MLFVECYPSSCCAKEINTLQSISSSLTLSSLMKLIVLFINYKFVEFYFILAPLPSAFNLIFEHSLHTRNFCSLHTSKLFNIIKILLDCSHFDAWTYCWDLGIFQKIPCYISFTDMNSILLHARCPTILPFLLRQIFCIPLTWLHLQHLFLQLGASDVSASFLYFPSLNFSTFPIVFEIKIHHVHVCVGVNFGFRIYDFVFIHVFCLHMGTHSSWPILQPWS